MGTKRKYPAAFRRMAVDRMRKLCQCLCFGGRARVRRTVLYHWYRQAEQQGTDETATSGR